jgi:hypothetical protein
MCQRKHGPSYCNVPTEARALILRPRVKIIKDKGFSRGDSEGASDAVQAGLLGVLSRTFEDNGYAVSVDPSVLPEWEKRRRMTEL